MDKLDVVITTPKDLSYISKEVYRLNESLGVLRDKLDKIIELLTPQEVKVNSSISITSSNEHSPQAKDINEALYNLAKKLDNENNNRIDKRPVVIERNKEGKRLREGLLNNDMTVEWKKQFS